ncbi:MAG: hypothetical protein LBB36_04205, partial [Fibromonadaceae bacterium]|nr:hypothetical protein [Fibromonadaceae bacterium]
NGIYLKAKPKDDAGTEYEAVLIGAQTWMAENLNYDVEGSKCYNNNVGEDYCSLYGRLYDWATAMVLAADCNDNNCTVQSKHKGICPEDWHIPSPADWDALMAYVYNDNYESGSAQDIVGKYLKAQEGWNDYNSQSGNGEDKYGFFALPGGYYSKYDAIFINVGEVGRWHTTTYQYSANVDQYRMFYSNNRLTNGNDSKMNLISVRCIKD